MTTQSYGEAAQSCNNSRPGQLAIIDTADKYDFLVNNMTGFIKGMRYVRLNNWQKCRVSIHQIDTVLLVLDYKPGAVLRPY